MSRRRPYVVEIVETVTYRILVRARDEDQAIRKAEGVWEGGDDHYHVSDWESGRVIKCFKKSNSQRVKGASK